MNPTLSSALVSAAVALVIFFGSRAADRRSQAATNALENRKADSEGKAVDLSVLQASINDLKDRLGNAEGRVDVLESDLETERQARLVAIQRAEAAESRAQRAEARADRLEARVTQLETTLRANDIAVPPIP